MGTRALVLLKAETPPSNVPTEEVALGSSRLDEAAFKALVEASDRALAPLFPSFYAMAPQWPSAMRPERVTRALLLMVAGCESVEALVHRVGEDPRFARFLRMAPNEPLDAALLAEGLARLAKNINVRGAVAAVVRDLRTGAWPPANEALLAAWMPVDA